MRSKRRTRARARKRRHTKPHSKRTFLPTAIGKTGGVLLASAAYWFFRKQAKHVVRGNTDAFDDTILDLVHSTHSESTDRVLRAATFLGEHFSIGAVAYIAALSMHRRNRPAEAWTILISTGGAMVLNTAMKAIFQRERPQQRLRKIRLPKSHSFPSGHSLLSAATYPIVIHHLVSSRSVSTQVITQIMANAIVVTVGYSRIYFGVHFPSDVLGGFAAGFGWIGLTALTHDLASSE